MVALRGSPVKQPRGPAAPSDVWANHFSHLTEGRRMSGASLTQVLYGFATELRTLAYTMPGGGEIIDPWSK